MRSITRSTEGEPVIMRRRSALMDAALICNRRPTPVESMNGGHGGPRRQSGAGIVQSGLQRAPEDRHCGEIKFPGGPDPPEAAFALRADLEGVHEGRGPIGRLDAELRREGLIGADRTLAAYRDGYPVCFLPTPRDGPAAGPLMTSGPLPGSVSDRPHHTRPLRATSSMPDALASPSHGGPNRVECLMRRRATKSRSHAVSTR